MLGILNRINVVVPMITVCIRPRMREALLGHTESYYYYASTEDSPIGYYWIETVVVCADVVLPIGYTSCTFFIRWTLLQILLTILAVRCTREWLQQGYITRDSIATLENHGEEQADADADAEHTQLAIITGIEDSASPNDRRCTRPN